MATALITGSSSGIGLELAKIHASEGYNLVLVARSKIKLDELKAELQAKNNIKVYTIGKDLATLNAAQDIFDELSIHRIRVDYLINNAGFGEYGPFLDRSMAKYREMVHLNILSLTELSYLFGKEMVNRGSGKIMNVASMAGLQPDPNFAVYGATKSYVISLTEAIHKELEGTGVTVTVLSPGATESNFMERADMNNAKLYASGVMTSLDVAREGYNGMMKGKLHVIPGFKNKILGFFSGIMPPGKLRLSVAAKIMAEK
jgi:short-subunit dehydrogenase